MDLFPCLPSTCLWAEAPPQCLQNSLFLQAGLWAGDNSARLALALLVAGTALRPRLTPFFRRDRLPSRLPPPPFTLSHSLPHSALTCPHPHLPLDPTTYHCPPVTTCYYPHHPPHSHLPACLSSHCWTPVACPPHLGAQTPQPACPTTAHAACPSTHTAHTPYPALPGWARHLPAHALTLHCLHLTFCLTPGVYLSLSLYTLSFCPVPSPILHLFHSLPATPATLPPLPSFHCTTFCTASHSHLYCLHTSCTLLPHTLPAYLHAFWTGLPRPCCPASHSTVGPTTSPCLGNHGGFTHASVSSIYTLHMPISGGSIMGGRIAISFPLHTHPAHTHTHTHSHHTSHTPHTPLPPPPPHLLCSPSPTHRPPAHPATFK